MIATSQFEEDLLATLTSTTFNDYHRAAHVFAQAYQRFAMQVLSGTGGRATTIPAGAAQLEGILTGAYASKNLSNTARVLTNALMAFWQMQPWSGGVGPGQTTNPGHVGVEAMLISLFSSGTSQGDPRFHARELARICAMGVRQVVITEYPPDGSPKITTAV